MCLYGVSVNDSMIVCASVSGVSDQVRAIVSMFCQRVSANDSKIEKVSASVSMV